MGWPQEEHLRLISNGKKKKKKKKKKRSEKQRENEKRPEKASGSSAKNRERLNNFATDGDKRRNLVNYRNSAPPAFNFKNHNVNRNVFQFQYSTSSKSSLIHLSTGHNLSIQIGSGSRTSG